MSLDIRLPIGLLFLSLGVLLVAYGLMTPAALYERSLGINVNLWWGLAMLAFGAGMTYFGARGSKDAPAPAGGEPPAHRPAGGH